MLKNINIVNKPNGKIAYATRADADRARKAGVSIRLSQAAKTTRKLSAAELEAMEARKSEVMYRAGLGPEPTAGETDDYGITPEMAAQAADYRKEHGSALIE